MGDARDEVRAAGRAILLLIEEIERLNVDLWHAGRLVPPETPAESEPGAAPEPVAESEPEAASDEFGSALRRRLGSFRYQTPSPPAGEP